MKRSIQNNPQDKIIVLKPWHIGEPLALTLFRQLALDKKIPANIYKFLFGDQVDWNLVDASMECPLVKMPAKNSKTDWIEFDSLHRLDVLLHFKKHGDDRYVAVEVKLGTSGQGESWKNFASHNFKNKKRIGLANNGKTFGGTVSAILANKMKTDDPEIEKQFKRDILEAIFEDKTFKETPVKVGKKWLLIVTDQFTTAPAKKQKGYGKKDTAKLKSLEMDEQLDMNCLVVSASELLHEAFPARKTDMSTHMLELIQLLLQGKFDVSWKNAFGPLFDVTAGPQ